MKNMAWNIVLIVINIFVLYPIVFVSSQTYSPPCKIENNGYTLDFSTLKGKRFLSKEKKNAHALSYVIIVNQRDCRDNPSGGVSTYYYFSVHLMCEAKSYYV